MYVNRMMQKSRLLEYEKELMEMNERVRNRPLLVERQRQVFFFSFFNNEKNVTLTNYVYCKFRKQLRANYKKISKKCCKKKG